MLDDGSEFSVRVARRLREETIVWLTTVTPSGAPLPRPVGFLWDGDDNVLVYSQPGTRIRNIARNPKVTLNFDGDDQSLAGRGDDGRADHHHHGAARLLFARFARQDEERQSLLDLAAASGIELSDERARRAAHAGTTERLKKRIMQVAPEPVATEPGPSEPASR